MPLSTQRSESPATMAAVLTAAGQPAGVRVEFAVGGTWPALAAAAGSPQAAPGATPRADARATRRRRRSLAPRCCSRWSAARSST